MNEPPARLRSLSNRMFQTATWKAAEVDVRTEHAKVGHSAVPEVAGKLVRVADVVQLRQIIVAERRTVVRLRTAAGRLADLGAEEAEERLHRLGAARPEVAIELATFATVAGHLYGIKAGTAARVVHREVARARDVR